LRSVDPDEAVGQGRVLQDRSINALSQTDHVFVSRADDDAVVRRNAAVQVNEVTAVEG
jgi:hypothetical protein